MKAKTTKRTKGKRPTKRKRVVCTMADVLHRARPTKATKRTARKSEK